MRSVGNWIIWAERALYPFRVINSYSKKLVRRLGGDRAVGLSTAAKCSMLFFLCFVIFITTIWIVSVFDPDSYYSKNFLPTWREGIFYWLKYPVAYLLALIITIVLYWGIRLATLEKPSLYPEIDQCWQPLEAWREKENLGWHEFRRYLVLGTDLDVSKAMHAEMKDRKIGPLPSADTEWMHWFGSQDAVYCHLKKICHTSQRLETLNSADEKGGTGFIGGHTLQASASAQDWSAGVDMLEVTAEVESGFGQSFGEMGGSLDPAESLDPYGSGEMMMSDLEDTEVSYHGKVQVEEALGEDGDTPIERVDYLTRLLQVKTLGEMPFHGVVVVIPFDKFITRENSKSITLAIKNDLLEIRRQTNVAFPVSFVFCSMERDPGFPKLQNLLGSQRVQAGRFGAGCRVENVPVIDKQNIGIQVSRACQAFEDWVMNRWGKSSQLGRAAQNKELFKLVVRIRQVFRPKLEYLFENALLWKPTESPTEDDSPTDLTLAGCYFVSTGDHSADRGFLNGVFLKCQEFATTASWSDNIVDRDRLYSVAASVVFALSLFLILAVCIWFFTTSQTA